VSFAFFTYENSESVINFLPYDDYQVGFDAGDGSAALNIVGSESSATYTENLSEVNLFRIDGN